MCYLKSVTSTIMCSSSALLYAAIDFGTTFSGYAYCYRDECRDDELKIYTDRERQGKVPTVVLFDKTGNFHSFGHEAEEKYLDLAETDDHLGWKYFQRFKMQLFENKRVRRNIKLVDDQGRKMKAIDVFAAVIKHFKNRLLESVWQRDNGLREEEISWVITVPAIWSDAAKQFMIEAGNMAGIPPKQLTLALEPEAAAIYCKHMKLAKASSGGKQCARQEMKSFEPGMKFLILDLGGGTVDITAHEVERNGTLKGLLAPAGGPFGGTLVDQRFKDFLKSLFTEAVLQTFAEEFKSEQLDLIRTIENQKKISEGDKETVVVPLPAELYETFRGEHRTPFENLLLSHNLKDSVSKKRGKLFVQKHIIKNMFNESMENIVHIVETIMEKPDEKMKGLNTILMVGGFSESPIVQNAVRNRFRRCNVIVPEDAQLAVLKGAVMFGHDVNQISSRVILNSYGVSTALPFEPGRHPPSNRCVNVDGVTVCTDVFKVFVHAGDTVLPGKTSVRHTFNKHSQKAVEVTVEIYKSPSATPQYTNDETSSRVGELTLNVPKKHGTERVLIDVHMKFGGTHIEVEAREKGTANTVKAWVDFLA